MMRCLVCMLLFNISTLSFGVQAQISVSTSNLCSDYAPGEIMFHEAFESDTLNMSNWEYEINMNGGGNGEFQIYINSPNNTYIKEIKDGRALHLKPTLVNDTFGDSFLYEGTLDLNPLGCTDPGVNATGNAWVCKQTGSKLLTLPPCFSSRLRTKGKFSFTYGKVEIVAKLPQGDWIWPAMWLLPEQDLYGQWPLSGEIDLVESRGNKWLKDWATGENVGNKHIATTLHFGFDWSQDGWTKAHMTKNSDVGFDDGFHRYTMLWTSDRFEFLVDGEPYGHNVVPGDNGFFSGYYGFDDSKPNPWNVGITKNLKMAPFDQPFYIVFNVAVGGIWSYFQPKDKGAPPCEEPRSSIWYSNDEFAKTQFWERREKWYPSWKNEDEDATALKVKSITVFAI